MVSDKQISISLKKSIGAAIKAQSLYENSSIATCADIVMLIDSAIGSLKSSRKQLINHYMDECLAGELTEAQTQKLKDKLNQLHQLLK